MQAAVEVLHQSDRWGAQQCDVEELCSSHHDLPGVAIAFLSTEDDPTLVQRTFGVPPAFWDGLHQEASGFFDAREKRSQTDQIESYNTLFRFLIKHPRAGPNDIKNDSQHIEYDWLGIGFFARWKPSGSSTLLCFDLPHGIRRAIKHALVQTNLRITPDLPFAIHEFVLDYMVHAFDRSVWAWRDLVRDTEQTRPRVDGPRPSYANMHELARHTIHSSEMLATALVGVEAIMDEHANRSPDGGLGHANLELVRRFRCQKTLLECIHARSKALELRLQNEMNLAFHINTQQDSVIVVKIAEAAQTDGAAMRTISFLGLVFLPGTFISAIFSMSFFNFTPESADSPQQWRISNRFWVYWVVAIPVTAFTVAFWIYWQKVSMQAIEHPAMMSTKPVKPPRKLSKAAAWMELRQRRPPAEAPPSSHV